MFPYSSWKRVGVVLLASFWLERVVLREMSSKQSLRRTERKVVGREEKEVESLIILEMIFRKSFIDTPSVLR